MAFFFKIKWERPDGGPLAGAIADMPSKWRQQPDITMLAGTKANRPLYLYLKFGHKWRFFFQNLIDMGPVAAH